jgi:hypothetical protein
MTAFLSSHLPEIGLILLLAGGTWALFTGAEWVARRWHGRKTEGDYVKPETLRRARKGEL